MQEKNIVVKVPIGEAPGGGYTLDSDFTNPFRTDTLTGLDPRQTVGIIHAESKRIETAIAELNNSLRLEIDQAKALLASSITSLEAAQNELSAIQSVLSTKEAALAKATHESETSSQPHQSIAALEVQFYNAAIEHLKKMHTESESAVHQALAEQANAEAARIAAEQAAAEAARIAAEQAAAEAARIAAEQAAAEAARIAAEQAAAEAARIAAEQATAKNANSARVAATAVVAGPVLFGTGSMLPMAQATAVLVRSTLAAAIAGLAGFVAATASAAVVGVTALVYSPRLGNGELPKGMGLSVPLADLAPGLAGQLANQPPAQATVELPVRLATAPATEDAIQVVAVPTGASVPSDVKVIAATFDAASKTYTAQTADTPPRTLVWTPAVPPIDASTTLPGESTVQGAYEGPVLEPVEAQVLDLPAIEVLDLDDMIIVFPADSGMAPIYVMYASRRNEPGVVVGEGRQLTADWLNTAISTGTAIPASAAAILLGRSYSSFNSFRRAFWRAVSKNPLLIENLSRRSASSSIGW